MSRCSGYRAAIKNHTATITAMVGLLSVAACAGPTHNLSDPAKFKTIEHALRTDLTKVEHDLQREVHDRRRGASGNRESRCYNLKNNVNFVVLSTIRPFVLTTVAADRNSMQNDINHMRSDRSGFEKDILDFINDGVARPVGANRAIAEITQKIIRAKAKANRMISAVNKEVRKAYAIANDLASGRCFGDGPGTHIPRIAPLS
jgi:hypothetical protein